MAPFATIPLLVPSESAVPTNTSAGSCITSPSSYGGYHFAAVFFAAVVPEADCRVKPNLVSKSAQIVEEAAILAAGMYLAVGVPLARPVECVNDAATVAVMYHPILRRRELVNDISAHARKAQAGADYLHTAARMWLRVLNKVDYAFFRLALPRGR